MTDFAAIDFETANGQRSSVCSVGVVVVRKRPFSVNALGEYLGCCPRPVFFEKPFLGVLAELLGKGVEVRLIHASECA